MATEDTPPDGGRLSIDDMVARIGDPGFAQRFRRPPTMRGTGSHANPLMLAVSGPDSLYVMTWRRHAARCDACRGLFVYFGLRVDS
jgi:hypothetical protein